MTGTGVGPELVSLDGVAAGDVTFDVSTFAGTAFAGGDFTHVIQLLWSGNWRIEARHRWDGTTVSAGLPRAGLSHRLAPGGTEILHALHLDHARPCLALHLQGNFLSGGAAADG